MKIWQRNIFYRTYKEKEALDQTERIACQTAPAMVIRPRKYPYFKLLFYNLLRLTRSKEWKNLN